MRKVVIIALIALLSGCAANTTGSSYTISQNDVRSISLDTQSSFSASRVIVLANGVAEIIQSLNGQSIIVGRDISSTEDSLADIPIVTSGHQVLPEKVISLNPDLVLIDASTGPKAAIATIKAAGIRVVETPESWSLSDLPRKVRAVGAAIGAPELRFMYPTNGGVSRAQADALSAIPGFDVSRIGPDCHVGGGGGVQCAINDFNAMPDFKQSFINCETNAAISSMERAIQESSDLQTWFNVNKSLQERLWGRAASFCSERSGHFDGFDQGRGELCGPLRNECRIAMLDHHARFVFGARVADQLAAIFA